MLTEQQQQRYRHDGCLLISGLIPDQVSAAAEAAVWRLIEASRDDPSTWTSIPSAHRRLPDSDLLACFTPELLAAAALLAEDDPATFRPPATPYAINVFPTEAEWKWPRPHIDHAIKEHAHRTFPRPFRIAAMLFLNDVPSHGGGTVVWPGSHRILGDLARSDPARYETMWALNQELGKIALGDAVETTPRRGDVLFYDTLCAHAGSMNTSYRPRLALNMKW
jgi:ectoine hydroxylase-related dioxygenase (phytanoyl-CoA dioxygenase family)